LRPALGGLVALNLDFVGIKDEQMIKPGILEEFLHGALGVLVRDFGDD
jgi:hypothetical protein